jgi:addiction module HigA family antidote
MAMFNPPHPGEGLKDDIEALHLTTAEAAKALGVTRQQLHRVLTGVSAISPEMAIRLEAVIGSTADHWLRLQANYDLDQLRQYQADMTNGLRRLAIGDCRSPHKPRMKRTS